MNTTKDSMKQLDAELAHAGEATTLSPQMLLLEKLRITPETRLKPMDFLFQLYGKPCFPRGELVAITGKAKSGKTFVTSMLMACCVTQKVLAFERLAEDTESAEKKPLRVLWYDTEQSDESTQDILRNRIMKMVIGSPPESGGARGGLRSTSSRLLPSGRKNERTIPHVQTTSPAGTEDCSIKTQSPNSGGEIFPEHLYDIFNVRSVGWEERRSLLGEAVKRYDPDLVIIDGIRDLVNDINDGVLAQEVMEELMHLAAEKKCCIVCVLHQNKGSEDHNLRGWIGTELMNKAFEVYSCEKLLPQRIFKLEQTLTRKYDIEQAMYFEVKDDGIPVMTINPPVDSDSKDNNGDFPQLNADYISHDEQGNWKVDVCRLFCDAIAGRQQVTGAELRTEVCRLANICSWKFYNTILDQAINEGVLMKSYDHANHVIYAVKPF